MIGPPAVRGVDWEITRLVKVTDGDTVRALRRRSVYTFTGAIAEGIGYRRSFEVFDDPMQEPLGVALRLITLNTPERGRPGFFEALADLAYWLGAHVADGCLRCETWPGGGFDRLLADLYCANDRADTASAHMLRRGWEPYLGIRGTRP